jgi:hypothetical protein
MNALNGGCLDFIAGAQIGGISELDTITMLNDAIDRATTVADLDISSHRELFRAKKQCPPILGSRCRFVSAGYLAFRLPGDVLFAFPPGYNEDWLWCLIHAAASQVQIVSLGEVVMHDPPVLKQLSQAELLFELTGDIVFGSVEERVFPLHIDPEGVLMCLVNHSPPIESMPSARAFEVMHKVRCAKVDGLFPILQDYGVRELATLLGAGKLEMDGTRVMNDWASDAIVKQRSLALTLRDGNAMAALNSLCQEGTI